MLLIGNGGREHALAWKLAQSPQCAKLVCVPGNPGIAAEPNVHVEPSLKPRNHTAMVEYCTSHQIGLVLVGPEAPLVDGLVDSLHAASVPTFGPTRAAAQLEGSKAFMKVRCLRPRDSANCLSAWPLLKARSEASTAARARIRVSMSHNIPWRARASWRAT